MRDFHSSFQNKQIILEIVLTLYEGFRCKFRLSYFCIELTSVLIKAKPLVSNKIFLICANNSDILFLHLKTPASHPVSIAANLKNLMANLNCKFLFMTMCASSIMFNSFSGAILSKKAEAKACKTSVACPQLRSYQRPVIA